MDDDEAADATFSQYKIRLVQEAKEKKKEED